VWTAGRLDHALSGAHGLLHRHGSSATYMIKVESIDADALKSHACLMDTILKYLQPSSSLKVRHGRMLKVHDISLFGK